ncbi:hypothetical protein [Bythopirellula goksoeyrii]|nr:hypothetical protein [Bythopirellula goksoeyrii]
MELAEFTDNTDPPPIAPGTTLNDSRLSSASKLLLLLLASLVVISIIFLCFSLYQNDQQDPEDSRAASQDVVNLRSQVDALSAQVRNELSSIRRDIGEIREQLKTKNEPFGMQEIDRRLKDLVDKHNQFGKIYQARDKMLQEELLWLLSSEARLYSSLFDLAQTQALDAVMSEILASSLSPDSKELAQKVKNRAQQSMETFNKFSSEWIEHMKGKESP